MRSPTVRWAWLPLVVLTLAVYSPVFGAGFLSYDDPWLIQRNPFFKTDLRTLGRALFDLSYSTRMALGAEYLPLRDLLVWFEVRLFGVSAPAMHTVSVALYLGALLLLRSTLHNVLRNPRWAELAVLLFALHPIHVESVAWLAGQKDVLALLFVAAAMQQHAAMARWARLTVPLLVFAAGLSKAMSVAVILLLVAHDFLLKREFDRVLHIASGLVIAFLLALHSYVGSVVGMVGTPAGGTRYTALITMGPVWLRYVLNCILPLNLSITYRVPDATSWSSEAAAGYALIAALLALAVLQWRKSNRLPLVLFVWFLGPLLPVSQLGAPLQNRMADRYAWLSVLAPCVLAAALLARPAAASAREWLRSAGAVGAALLSLSLGWLTFQRSALFGDTVELFADAAAQDPDDVKGAYHYARALSEAQRDEDAMAAFREALRRAGDSTPRERRRATNGLAKLLAKHGRMAEAEQLLRHGLAAFPNEPTLLRNLIKVLRHVGKAAEAERLQAELARIAPSAEPERPE